MYHSKKSCLGLCQLTNSKDCLGLCLNVVDGSKVIISNDSKVVRYFGSDRNLVIPVESVSGVNIVRQRLSKLKEAS